MVIDVSAWMERNTNLRLVSSHSFLLATVWLTQITVVSNVVFMVFGAVTADKIHGPLGNNTTSAYYQFHSLVAEFRLEPDGPLAFVPTLLITLQLVGALLGALAGGQISDSYGRKVNTWLWLSATVVSGTMSAFCPTWEVMAVARFAIGFATGACDASAIVYAMEWMDERYCASVCVRKGGLAGVRGGITASNNYNVILNFQTPSRLPNESRLHEFSRICMVCSVGLSLSRLALAQCRHDRARAFPNRCILLAKRNT